MGPPIQVQTYTPSYHGCGNVPCAHPLPRLNYRLRSAPSRARQHLELLEHYKRRPHAH